jgi:hypothetical protein
LNTTIDDVFQTCQQASRQWCCTEAYTDDNQWIDIRARFEAMFEKTTVTTYDDV